jgi:hypothetical protein
MITDAQGRRPCFPPEQEKSRAHRIGGTRSRRRCQARQRRRRWRDFRWRGTFAALSVRNFRRYISRQALSLIGTWVQTVAQALLVLHLTHSGVILGLTTAARFAPVLRPNWRAITSDLCAAVGLAAIPVSLAAWCCHASRRKPDRRPGTVLGISW